MASLWLPTALATFCPLPGATPSLSQLAGEYVMFLLAGLVPMAGALIFRRVKRK